MKEEDQIEMKKFKCPNCTGDTEVAGAQGARPNACQLPLLRPLRGGYRRVSPSSRGEVEKRPESD